MTLKKKIKTLKQSEPEYYKMVFEICEEIKVNNYPDDIWEEFHSKLVLFDGKDRHFRYLDNYEGAIENILKIFVFLTEKELSCNYETIYNIGQYIDEIIEAGINGTLTEMIEKYIVVLTKKMDDSYAKRDLLKCYIKEIEDNWENMNDELKEKIYNDWIMCEDDKEYSEASLEGLDKETYLYELNEALTQWFWYDYYDNEGLNEKCGDLAFGILGK
jgi:hypothetical protein